MEPVIRLFQSAREARFFDRLDDAHRQLSEAVQLCRAAEDAPWLAGALTRLAQIERDLGHADASLARYDEAVRLMRADGPSLALASALRHQGDFLCEQGQLEPAETLLAEALAIYRADPETGALELANALRPMALLHEAAGRHMAAVPFWREARSLYAQVSVQPGIDECDEHLNR